jgi:hypothetical protein
MNKMLNGKIMDVWYEARIPYIKIKLDEELLGTTGELEHKSVIITDSPTPPMLDVDEYKAWEKWITEENIKRRKGRSDLINIDEENAFHEGFNAALEQMRNKWNPTDEDKN